VDFDFDKDNAKSAVFMLRTLLGVIEDTMGPVIACCALVTVFGTAVERMYDCDPALADVTMKTLCKGLADAGF